MNQPIHAVFLCTVSLFVCRHVSVKQSWLNNYCTSATDRRTSATSRCDISFMMIVYLVSMPLKCSGGRQTSSMLPSPVGAALMSAGMSGSEHSAQYLHNMPLPCNFIVHWFLITALKINTLATCRSSSSSSLFVQIKIHDADNMFHKENGQLKYVVLYNVFQLMTFTNALTLTKTAFLISFLCKVANIYHQQ